MLGNFLVLLFGSTWKYSDNVNTKHSRYSESVRYLMFYQVFVLTLSNYLLSKTTVIIVTKYGYITKIRSANKTLLQENSTQHDIIKNSRPIKRASIPSLKRLETHTICLHLNRITPLEMHKQHCTFIVTTGWRGFQSTKPERCT